ncbi:hypothetical protein FRUB_09543 [Fimbriiglobus ruber]|uniref:Uncharacterized protein n=1 Tax=Fimbriiglobus ruber TaxID=1908690 RepID=A0A225CZC7_9BACT|nr:hypothetical protein FRUB_09543 [Fimbriiglobus ruber]
MLREGILSVRTVNTWMNLLAVSTFPSDRSVADTDVTRDVPEGV